MVKKAPVAPPMPPAPPVAPAPPASIQPPSSQLSAKVESAPMPSGAFRAPVFERRGYDKSADKLKSLRRKMNDAVVKPTRGPVVSTGIAGVDLCLDGGVNFGSIHEFFGFSKAGKTYLMQRAAAVAQSQYEDCIVVYFDRENACSVEIMGGSGIDINRSLLIPPSEIPTPEDLWVKVVEVFVSLDVIDEDKAASLVKDVAETGDPTLPKKGKKPEKDFVGRSTKGSQPYVVVVIDSIPAFAEQHDMIEDQGRRAKKWHAFFRRATTLLNAKTMFLVSNHIIYKPGMYNPGGNESKTSGVAIDYYRDCGVKCMQLHHIFDANNVQIGVMIGVEVDKTRRGGAGGHTFFPVFYASGASYWSGILPFSEYIGFSSQSNTSAFKDKKAFGRVWPKYEITTQEGKTVKLDESDPEVLQRACEQYGIYDSIMKIVNEKLSIAKA